MVLNRSGSFKGTASAQFYQRNNDESESDISIRAPGFLSVPNLPIQNDQFGIGSPHRRPSRFISAGNSIFSTRSPADLRPYFRSRRIKKGTIDRPELRDKDPRRHWITAIPFLGLALGLASIGALAWNGWASVSNHKYCEVFIDDFSEGFNSTIWVKEVQTGGFG